MNELKVNGTQKFMGIDIPIVEGGFGEDCRVMTANTISEIHKSRLDKINELILNNISEFEEGVDIIDLMNDEKSLNLAKGLGFVTNNRQKHCYLLSEQGYMLLVGFMKTDKAKEIRKKVKKRIFYYATNHKFQRAIKSNISFNHLQWWARCCNCF